MKFNYTVPGQFKKNYLFGLIFSFLLAFTPLLDASAQSTKTINGKISTSNGEPLPGASIAVKNTTIGVVSDLNGQFELAGSMLTHKLW